MRPGCRAPALVTLLLLLLGCPPAGADETAPPPPATDLCTLLQLPFVPATCVTTDESQLCGACVDDVITLAKSLFGTVPCNRTDAENGTIVDRPTTYSNCLRNASLDHGDFTSCPNLRSRLFPRCGGPLLVLPPFFF